MAKTVEQLEAENATLQQTVTTLSSDVKKIADERAAEKSAAEKAASEKAAAEKAAAEKSKAGNQDQSLVDRVNTLETNEKTLKRNQAESRIVAILEKRGIDSTVAKDFIAPKIYTDHADQIEVDNKFNVTVKSKDGTKADPVDAFVNAYLETDIGKKILPPKANPTPGDLVGNAQARTGSAKIKYTQEQVTRGEVDWNKINSGEAVVDGL